MGMHYSSMLTESTLKIEMEQPLKIKVKRVINILESPFVIGNIEKLSCVNLTQLFTNYIYTYIMYLKYQEIGNNFILCH